MTGNLDRMHAELDRRDRARRAKYIKEKCCVCGKYGANVPFGEPVEMLRAQARVRKLTLKGPDHNAIHAKCLAKLKGLICGRT